jgi:hypothetical protein
MNIYFYDNSAVPYQRLGNRISNELINNKQRDIKLFYIYDGYNKEPIEFNEELEPNVTVLDSKKVLKHLQAYPADLFVCFGQPSRIPDAFWTLYFNRKGVETVRVQHGLFIKDYHRTGEFWKNERIRTVYYFTYLLLIFLFTRFGSKLGTILELVNRQVKFLSIEGKTDNRISSKIVIIWGEYWKSWFKSYPYYTDKNTYIICGGFDFEILQQEEKVIYPDGLSATYICQTLVEDGRLEKHVFEAFLERLYEFASGFEGHLYLKLHPRSSEDFYKKLNTLDNVSLTHKFPVSELYISHYSTLLTVSVYLKKKIVLIQFPGHSVPEAFDHMAQNVQNYDEKINLGKISDLNIKPGMDYYYTFIDNPYKRIAEILTTIQV